MYLLPSVCGPVLQGAFIPAHTLIFSLKEAKGALRMALTPCEVRVCMGGGCIPPAVRLYLCDVHKSDSHSEHFHGRVQYLYALQIIVVNLVHSVG